jgi:hypothetical protein
MGDEKPKASPGPWRWDDYDGSTQGRGGDLVDANDCPVIATLATGPDTARIEAYSLIDALLISHAPDLLAMLRELQFCGQWDKATGPRCPMCDAPARTGYHAPDCRLAALLSELT